MPKLRLDKMKWSFSRVTSFEQCPLGWWYTYHYKINREVTNAFSEYGSIFHDIMARQMIFKMNNCNIMSNQQMKEEFQERFYQIPWKFPDGSRQKISYLNDGLNYLMNWDSFKNYNVKAVERFEDFNIDNYTCTGGMDLLLEKDDIFYLVDHKTSRPYDDLDMGSKIRQLYFYGTIIKLIFGKFPEYIGFNFVRKNKLNFLKWNNDKYDETIDWFKNGIKKIETSKGFKANPSYYFCNHICNHRLTCSEKSPIVRKENVDDFDGYE